MMELSNKDVPNFDVFSSNLEIPWKVQISCNE